ncbi:DUF2268 domain-containing putative Zn-dependent protease [Aquibacillus albus]|uniref:Uncharacterized protein YjaZ n=1 Tax=Aquibacillus albus TaxID=1168171 RepID=A0ABS2N395_9BACI|nr:uncharacterized protein YjaZ [Aquibacillus albus]
MTIIPTDQWLTVYEKNKKRNHKRNLQVQKEALCQKLLDYFPTANIDDLHAHLLSHGLFLPDPSDKQVIRKMIKRNVWKQAEKGLSTLKKAWKGPDVPVFIFPSNFTSRVLQREFNGLSGLSFRDKMFLFITDKTTTKELLALITHEYNHVCRLHFIDKTEEELCLLDSLILEGLAENAVRSLLGDKYIANWTKLYSDEEVKKHWKKWIKPNIDMKKTDRRHDILLYGKGNIPKSLGYNTGYHLVYSFLQNSNKSIFESLRLSSDEIFHNSSY